MQCFGSGLDSIRSVDPYLDPDSESDPDSGGQKRPTEVEKYLEISCFEVLDVLF
jgi:hypothetical protein